MKQLVEVQRVTSMSELQQGVVVKLDQVWKEARKPPHNKFPINYVELDNGARINVGFDQPYTVGQSVSIPTEVKYGELQVPRNSPSGSAGSTGTAPTGVAGSEPARPATSRAAYGRNTRFPVPKDHGDVAIMRQNALTNSVSFLAKRVAGVGELDDMSVDEAVELIISTAYTFCEFTTGQREERMAREILGVKEDEADE